MRQSTAYCGWALALALAGLLPGTTLAHGGGLDARGCHTESATGEYHCHGGGSASDPSAGSTRSGSTGQTAYDRDAYGDWRDRDGDCQDMREEILIRDADRYTLSNNRCWVERGAWTGPYTGQRLTDRSNVHIDHVVPLAEAHRSGAASWPRSKKQRFANDPDNLLATQGTANMSKSDRDPAEWLPDKGRCAYISRWVSVKTKYGLGADRAERQAIQRIRSDCR